MTSNDLNRVTDAIDALAGATSPDDAWLKADAFVRSTGANALNVAEIERGSGALRWFRSSMKASWLQDYLEQDFVSLDELLAAAQRGRAFTRMEDGYVQGIERNSQRARDLKDQLVQWDYRTLDSYAMAGQQSDAIRLVTLSRSKDAPSPTASERLLAALIGTAIRGPRLSTSPGATPFQLPDLSIRERDVLSYLAAGLRNEMIAWKLGIAEVTVRAHIVSARRKLGATTREQAIAIALRADMLCL